MKKVQSVRKERLFAALTAGVMLASSAALLLSARQGGVSAYAETGAEAPSAISSVSLTLSDDISMNYYVDVPADAADDAAPSMEFTLQTKDNKYTSSVVAYETVGDQWKFTYSGVTPQHMGDEVTATLTYTTAAGAQDQTNTRTTSLKEVLTNYTTSSADDLKISVAAYEKLQTLVADILTYGAESQKYVGYDTENLVTDGMTVTPSTFDGAALQDDYNLVNDSAEVSFYGAGLWFDNNLGIEVRFTSTAAQEDLSVKATVGERSKTLSVQQKGEQYSVVMPLSVLEFASPVTFQVQNGGEEIGEPLTYSVRTYIDQKQDSQTVGSLAKAVWNYYTSVKAYEEAAGVPADYRELPIGNNSTVAGDPGVWYYWADGTENKSYTFAADGRPSWQNGGAQATITQLDKTASGATGYFRFRYQPGGDDGTGLQAGDDYVVTFTVETNVDGTVGCKAGGDISVTAGKPLTITRTGTVSSSEAFFISVSSANFGDKIPAEGLFFRISNVSFEKVDVLEKKQNADVLKNPGTWFYHCGDLDLASPHWLGGDAISFSIDKINNNYCQLRYQPDLEEGAQYTLSFTVVANVDCTFRYCGTPLELTAGQEVTIDPVTRTVANNNDSIITLGFTNYTYNATDNGMSLTVTISNITITPVA